MKKIEGWRITQPRFWPPKKEAHVIRGYFEFLPPIIGLPNRQAPWALNDNGAPALGSGIQSSLISLITKH
jgi:hypothetical protein